MIGSIGIGGLDGGDLDMPKLTRDDIFGKNPASFGKNSPGLKLDASLGSEKSSAYEDSDSDSDDEIDIEHLRRQQDAFAKWIERLEGMLGASINLEQRELAARILREEKNNEDLAANRFLDEGSMTQSGRIVI